MENLNEIKFKLKQHFGSETFYAHWFVKSAVHTEGAKDYFDQAACWWLWDIIATECHNAIKNLDPDIHYFKIVVADDEAKLTLHDYQKELLWSRDIGFTTHPEGEMDLIVGWDGQRSTTCLVSEN